MVMIPSVSRSMLESCVGKKVERMVRYSPWPAQQVVVECAIAQEQVFSLCPGPLAVCFDDGSILGVSSDPEKNSVIVWLERAAEGKWMEDPLHLDAELVAIESDQAGYSTKFWADFNGCALSGFELVGSDDLNAVEQTLPSELGLCFVFREGRRFIASHGLHNGTDDFSVLADEQIPEPIGRHLVFSPL